MKEINPAEIVKTPISQVDFFTLRVIKAAQQIQKENPYGSKLHKQAWLKICDVAKALWRC